MLLPFVQLDLPGLIGLPDGRYLAREGEREQVLIVEAFGAPKPPGRLQRRTRPAHADPDDAVPVTRVSVTLAERFESETEAVRWLEATAGDAAKRAAEVRAAVRVVNRALNALRAAARDPLVQDIGATRALAVRVGFGSGDELIEGRWQQARELSPPRRGRLDDIDPQSRVAAVLSGRDRVHPSETLLERARLDIEQDRPGEARHGLRAARAALEDSPEGAPSDLAERIAEAEQRLDR
ncbi:MAG: hypothetical protein FJW90_02085 [Actinobacteria bacterium]|nr:hypothetical protein [Actinomycetota bacterium]